MDFLHFAKSQRYRSKVPLRQLQFTVEVYRAIVVEEETELLVEATVPWDGKVFSPAETLSLYKDLAHLTQRSHSRVALEPDAVPPPPLQSSAKAVEEVLRGVATGSAAGGSAPLLPVLPNMPALPSPTDVLAQLRRPQSSFFTRPSVEDFINTAEEDVPVDPPPGPSLLAPLILRQHRRDHQPNRRMFLMWAAGELVTPSTAPGPPQATAAGAAAGAPPPTPPLVDVSAAAWRGTERVLCTLTAEQDERVFTAKPSLNEVHTLFVDAAYIYTFVVTVSQAKTASAAPGRHGLWSAGSAAPALVPSAMAPLEVLLANVRGLAQYAEAQFEALEVSKDAVARRLLRQAALMAPLDRGSATEGVALSPGAAAALASTSAAGQLDASGRRRGRSALGLSLSLSVGDRGGAGGGAGGHALALSPSSRVGRPGTMRGASAVPRGLCQYYIFGAVERCVGVPESTLFVRCHLVDEGEAGAVPYDPFAPPSASGTAAGVLEFCSQLAHVGSFVAGECVLDIDHVFNLPFDYSVVSPVLPSAPLRLFATAYTEGPAAEGLQAPVAYACMSLPIASPGHHTLTAPMWAPHKTGVEFLRSALMGGAPALVDPRQAGPSPVHRTGVSVKGGLYADSVGVLHVTVNILHHRA